MEDTDAGSADGSVGAAGAGAGRAAGDTVYFCKNLTCSFSASVGNPAAIVEHETTCVHAVLEPGDAEAGASELVIPLPDDACTKRFTNRKLCSSCLPASSFQAFQKSPPVLPPTCCMFWSAVVNLLYRDWFRGSRMLRLCPATRPNAKHNSYGIITSGMYAQSVSQSDVASLLWSCVTFVAWYPASERGREQGPQGQFDKVRKHARLRC